MTPRSKLVDDSVHSLRPPPLKNEDDLNQILQRWSDAEARGESISLDELCAGSAHLRKEVEQRIAQTRQVKQPIAGKFTATDETYAAPSQADGALQAVSCNSPFSDLRLHSAGGLGAVYRATDQTLGREVAVKFIHREQAQVPENLEQFRLEAEVTGRLEHPGIVPLYGLGYADDGRLFYVMRFIEGQTLDEAIDEFHKGKEQLEEKERALAYRSLLNSFVSVCKTIAYAHNRGIVHRDIKPQNVMLGRFGETLVVDWGLAVPVSRAERFKDSGERTLMPGSTNSDSSSGGFAGTPIYMSPEQHSGDPADPAADIYSLGVTLYRLLTGKTPFDKCTISEIRLKAVRGEFKRPREVNSHVSAAMEAICLKAMSPAPSDRYPTALELARDVENYLADEKVDAYQEPLTRRLARWARRNRNAAQSLLTGLVAVTVVTVGAAILLASLAGSERTARQEAIQSRAKAVEARTAAQRNSAYYAAKSVAYELEYLREVLTESVANPEMRRLLQQWNQTKDKATQDKLQEWIVNRFDEKSAVAKAENWFIVGIEGMQVCRAPPGGSIGKNYGWRSYYYGGKRDLPQGEYAPPLQQHVHLGAVYRAIPYGLYKVPMSAPIRSPDGDQVIGVLGIGVDLGSYPVLQQASVVLIDLRSDFLEDGVEKQGLILHHPNLSKHLPDPSEDADGLRLPRLRDAKTLRELRRKVTAGALLTEFQDPLQPAAPLQTVGFAPVELSTAWPADHRQSGWVVVVLDGDTNQ